MMRTENENQCEAYNDIPYTPMERGAPTYFKKERCTGEKIANSKFCLIHSQKDEYEKERKKGWRVKWKLL
jgi:hypothetical protein